MRKSPGVTRFEFYFVISAISLIIVVGMGRYLALVEDTRRFTFEINARNLSTAIYNYHAQWIIAHQGQEELSYLTIDGMGIQFSSSGWPIAVLAEKNIVNEISITTCLSLWQHFLQTPPPISFTPNSYGSQDYHLSLHDKETCRYEYAKSNSNKIFVDYTPATGDVNFHAQPSNSK